MCTRVISWTIKYRKFLIVGQGEVKLCISNGFVIKESERKREMRQMFLLDGFVNIVILLRGKQRSCGVSVSVFFPVSMAV